MQQRKRSGDDGRFCAAHGVMHQRPKFKWMYRAREEDLPIIAHVTGRIISTNSLICDDFYYKKLKQPVASLKKRQEVEKPVC